MKVGDLVNHISSNVTIRKNGIIIKIDMGREMEPTLHTYEGTPLGGFYDIGLRYGGIQSDDSYKACFLYRVYWPDGTETVELGDELTTVA